MTEDSKSVKNWTYLSCPQCQEPIQDDKQIRCSNCQVLFDWD